MDDRIRIATEKLENEGHSINRIFLGDKPYYRIDEGTAIIGEQMRDIADGVYSFAELTDDLLDQRPSEEEG